MSNLGGRISSRLFDDADNTLRGFVGGSAYVKAVVRFRAFIRVQNDMNSTLSVNMRVASQAAREFPEGAMAAVQGVLGGDR